MMDYAKLVKDHIEKFNGRMPRSEEEWDLYLDLMNHAKNYANSCMLAQKIGIKAMKKWGVKTPDEIKAEGEKYFK